MGHLENSGVHGECGMVGMGRTIGICVTYGEQWGIRVLWGQDTQLALIGNILCDSIKKHHFPSAVYHMIHYQQIYLLAAVG